MKQFDSRNIDLKANKLLDFHVSLLKNKIPNFENEGESYYYYTGNDYIKLGYNKRKKLLSRTFNLELKAVLCHIDFPEDFLLKLQFKGFPHISGAAFVGKKESKKYSKLFENEVLIRPLIQEAKKVEIAYITLKYNHHTQQLEITVCPYSGAYLWVIFPPVFYDMRLKETEIYSVYRIAEIIIHYIKMLDNTEI